MLESSAAFSGFSVDDVDKAKEFYGMTLGLTFKDEQGGTRVQLPHGSEVWMYQKDDHQPAAYTMLNFVVRDIDAAMGALVSAGVTFERYPGSPQDDKGIMRGKARRMGPDIAWFKDPAGNTLSILEV